MPLSSENIQVSQASSRLGPVYNSRCRVNAISTLHFGLMVFVGEHSLKGIRLMVLDSMSVCSISNIKCHILTRRQNSYRASCFEGEIEKNIDVKVHFIKLIDTERLLSLRNSKMLAKIIRLVS